LTLQETLTRLKKRMNLTRKNRRLEMILMTLNSYQVQVVEVKITIFKNFSRIKIEIIVEGDLGEINLTQLPDREMNREKITVASLKKMESSTEEGDSLAIKMMAGAEGFL